MIPACRTQSGVDPFGEVCAGLQRPVISAQYPPSRVRGTAAQLSRLPFFFKLDEPLSRRPWIGRARLDSDAIRGGERLFSDRTDHVVAKSA